MAGTFVNDVAVARYKLDEDKVEDARELVAHRLMEMAHQLDEKDYHVALEHMVSEFLQAEIDARLVGGSPGVKVRSGRAMGEAMLPTVPLVRELITGVAQDIRPMLAPAQQLKFAGELMAFNTGLDVFADTMKRWSAGEVRPFENPFTGSDWGMKKDESGHTRAYTNAERFADRDVERGEWSTWQKYVEDAKVFYDLDESQAATADSILRECEERVAAITQSNDWHTQARRNRIWYHMLWQLQIGGTHPLRHFLEAEYNDLMAPVRSIGDSLKERVDGIPTHIQRQQAEGRVLDLLAEKGYDELARQVMAPPPETKSASPDSQAAPPEANQNEATNE